MRDFSDLRDERQEAAAAFPGQTAALGGDEDNSSSASGGRCGPAMVIVYSQGMAQLAGGVPTYGYGLSLEYGGGDLEGRLHYPLVAAGADPQGLQDRPDLRTCSSTRPREDGRGRPGGPARSPDAAAAQAAYRPPQWGPASPISTPTGPHACLRTSSRPKGIISAPTATGGSTGKVLPYGMGVGALAEESRSAARSSPCDLRRIGISSIPPRGRQP